MELYIYGKFALIETMIRILNSYYLLFIYNGKLEIFIIILLFLVPISFLYAKIHTWNLFKMFNVKFGTDRFEFELDFTWKRYRIFIICQSSLRNDHENLDSLPFSSFITR